MSFKICDVWRLVTKFDTNEIDTKPVMNIIDDNSLQRDLCQIYQN